ncbi:SpoIIE family protein phosphatase [Clostridiaceae bacterium M8S5]|nr:SpoIIE family protein phosphatase [Clostridiaceae bacterium M8S5]
MKKEFEWNFAYDILDGMIDWVRVVSIEGEVIYVNKTLSKDMGKNILGSKCYSLLCKDKHCINCISQKTMKTGESHTKIENVKEKTYSVKSSPIHDKNGDIYAAVEVFRDITKQKILENKLTKKNIDMQRDIDFARVLQHKILPEKGKHDFVDIDYIYEPSKLLSGDIFDIFNIGERYMGVYICDVVGHGVTASMLTMFIRQTMRAIKDKYHSPAKTLKLLHEEFIRLNLDDDKYFTIFYGIFDKSNYTLSCANAGHNCAPILIKNNKVSLIEMTGFPIMNLYRDIQYREQIIKIKENDSLIFYTDGVIEAKNDIGEYMGIDRFLDMVKSNINKDLLLAIQRDMQRLNYDNKHDDIAILKINML